MRIKGISLTIFILTILLIASSCTNSQEFNETKDSEISNSETSEANENQSTEVSESNISEKDAKEFFRDYLKTLYTIEDFRKLTYDSFEDSMKIYNEMYNEIKPFMTENGYNRKYGNRFFGFLSDFAKYRQLNIALKSVDFRLESKNESNIFYWYEAALSLKALDGSTDHLLIDGQVNIASIDNSFKIERDHSNYSIIHSTSLGETYITDRLHSVIQKNKDGTYKQIKSYIPKMYFAVSNTTDEQMELNFPSNQQFNLLIYQNEEKIWDYSESKDFNQEAFSTILESGEHLVYYLNFPEKLKPGSYEYTFKLLDENFSDVAPLKGNLTIKNDY